MAGCLWSWGSDVYGRLGLGTEDQHRARPTEVKAFSSVELAVATCGSAHNIVVDTDVQLLLRGVARINGKGVLTWGPKGPGKIFRGHAH